jgi:hypothetical protein
MKKEKKSDQNAVAELTREWLYKENKWLWEENRKLKDSNTILKKGWQVVFTLEKRIDELLEENKKLKEDVEFFRQCYLDLKKLCEDGWFLLPNEEIAKMFNLDEIK